MFLESATRLGVAPMVWMYRTTSGVVAHQGAIPVRAVGRWSRVDHRVVRRNDGARKPPQKAVGPMVVTKALEDLPLNISLGQTAHMRSLQFALGWVEVGPLKEYHVRAEAGCRAAREGAKPATAVRGARAFRAPEASGVSRAAPITGRRAYVGPWPRSEPRTIVCGNAFAIGSGCAVVRDASYLNWKYVDQPGQSFTRLDIERAGELVAVIVVMIRDHGPGYAYTRGFVVDLVVDPSDVVAVAAALRAGCDALAECGAALVRFDLLNEPLTNQLRAFGFTERGAERVLLVATGGADLALATAVTNPSAWLLTASDSRHQSAMVKALRS